LGDEWKIPETAGFTNFMDMIERGGLDAMAVNTPDSMHREPTIAALKAGRDVILPKPTSDKIAGTHTIIETLKATKRFMGVDFHKREDPITKSIVSGFGPIRLR
jgi:predicted dehydrogenase